MHLQKPYKPRRVSDTSEHRDQTTLMIRRCTNCAKLLAPLTTTCSSCRSATLEWVPSSGEGSIVSWKVVHRPTNRESGQWETSIIAIVQLDDGPWVYTTIEGEIPPPSDQPVRVRFEPKSTGDRFLVFTTRTASGRPSAGSDRSGHLLARDPKDTRSGAHVTEDNTYDSTWVRSLLRFCDFLEATKSLDTHATSVVRFAIRWAPFGGAGAGELLVTFGVTRWRYMQMIREALRPCNGDSRRVRALKRNLLDALSWAWRAYPDSSTPAPMASLVSAPSTDGPATSTHQSGHDR